MPEATRRVDQGSQHMVFNGDLGRVIGIDDEEGALTAEFDGRVVSYPFGELDSIVLAYATMSAFRKSRADLRMPLTMISPRIIVHLLVETKIELNTRLNMHA